MVRYQDTEVFMSAKYVGAIDQGTTSTRFILFDKEGKPCFSAQKEHKQIYPRPGWVEHSPEEILENTVFCIRETLKQAEIVNPQEEIAAVGITNQRETVIAWNRQTGKPYANAAVWQDLRGEDFINELLSAGGKYRFLEKTGLMLSPYFSGSKIKWFLDNVSGLREEAESGRAVFGTIDTWILWNLTGGANGGLLKTDVTNACRTFLMDLQTLTWDEDLLNLFGCPERALPKIVPSIPESPYGYSSADSPFGEGVPFAGILGDQQAALFGQTCFKAGMSKSTYGTGGFLLMNVGPRIVYSDSGLLTTVAYQKGKEKPLYALEGSVAVAGSLIQWVRDNLGLIKNSKEIDALAAEVEDNGGVYFVPAFAGLFAPYWRSRARGVICGLTGYADRRHIARAVLEATAFQTYDIFQAMSRDADIRIPELKVDGGMTNSEPLMQFQSDLLKIPVIRPIVTETTALGAAYAAGLSVGFWQSFDDLKKNWSVDKVWKPQMDAGRRLALLADWKKALERSYGWID